MYSKIEVINESIRSVLIADNTNTGKTVREIKYYCYDTVEGTYNIYATPVDDTGKFPQIVMNTTLNDGSEVLPTSEYIVNLKVYVPLDGKFIYPSSDLHNLVQRILDLINKKPDLLNSQTSKNLRCRLFNNYFVTDNNDYLDGKIVGMNVMFRCICDDEILN